MFLSLAIIFVVGTLGGWALEKLRLPKLVWYILLGILLSPSVLGWVDDSLLATSSTLRQVALVIILTRSGLSLDVKTLKSIGRPALLMCFLPACCEMLGVLALAPVFLGIDYGEALLLGSVLAAVSPAVVVPRMIKLQQEGFGRERHVPELVMAGASCDDIFVIVLFYAFKGMVANGSSVWTAVWQIPVGIVLGVVLGLVCGLALATLFRYVKWPVAVKIVLTLGVSFGMLALESAVKQFVNVSALLGIIVVGLTLLRADKDGATALQKGYQSLWSGFEILLFTLVGCATDVHYAVSSQGVVLLGLIVLALVCRSIGVCLCLIATPYNKKERLFVVLSYLPKATVQASIGGIALSEGLACGTLVLTGAVISILLTAPLGAVAIDTSSPRLLARDI